MASALLHMSCTQLNNDALIGMEADSYVGAYPNLGRTKRDQESDDLDRCQVKKRRKQSKPIRIASTDSLSDVDGKQPSWVGANHSNQDSTNSADEIDQHSAGYIAQVSRSNGHGTIGIGGISGDIRNGSDAEGSNEESCTETHNQEIKKEFFYPLNLSNTKSPSPKDSTDSYLGEDGRSWYKSQESLPIYPLHPLDPTALRNQVYQNNILIPSQTGIVLPNLKRIFVGNNENQINSPHRIFNPEAFCDLCNKEFCNKYFLKTHKANKHGIYMENVGTNSLDNLQSLPMVNYFSNNLSTLPPISTSQVKKPTANFSTTSNKSNSSSMRAFCNICQREFCNKYFVRRHKAKIHGLIETTDESQEYKLQMMQEKVDSSVDSNIPGPSTATNNNKTSSKEFQTREASVETLVEEDQITKANKVNNEMESEPELPDSPQNALNLLVSTWQGEECKESRSPDRNKKTPQTFIPLNGGAFCEICCKEYCNKYFLRIHKQKVHGIIMPTEKDEKKECSNSNSSNGTPFWNNSNQPMPLNLILREANKSDCDSYPCPICNISFPEPYLLKMHHHQMHTNQVKPQEVQVPQVPIQFPSLISPEQKSVQTQNTLDLTIQLNENIKNTPPAPEISSHDKLFLANDVQKLHSMIMKLNNHVQSELYFCDICNKDFGRTSSLENHIIKEHSVLLEEISNGFYEENLSSQMNCVNNKYDCPKCPKYFPSSSLLEQHIIEKHTVCEQKIRNGDENADVNMTLSLQGDRQVMHTPTSSFCEICKKELCNKYFMKTHMQRMHGISIENGAHIGGVVCDICNKELCSKYFLRVHKQNSHGIVEEAFLPQVGLDVKNQISNPDSALKPTENELAHRYFSHFTEVCTICSRRFRSVKWLKTHLLNDHGEEGKDKWRELQLQNNSKNLDQTPKKTDTPYTGVFRNVTPEEPSTSYQSIDSISSILNKTSSRNYQCSYCSFTTTVLSLLFVHERSHFLNTTENQDIKCSLCLKTYDSYESLEQHIITSHHNTKCKASEDMTGYQTQMCDQSVETTEKVIVSATDDNNYNEISDSKLFLKNMTETCLKCSKCNFSTNHLDTYVDHIAKDHNDEEVNFNYFQIVRDALLQLANNSLVPASFAIPNNIGNFIMQPFVLEDRGVNSNGPSAFLSSLVFLPVKERLNKPITASFKLTPT